MNFPTTQIAAGQLGQVLILVGVYDDEAVKIDYDVNNVILDGGTGITLGSNDVLTLMWIQGNWVEISRADNSGFGGSCL